MLPGCSPPQLGWVRGPPSAFLHTHVRAHSSMGKQHGIGNSKSEALGLGQGSVCYFLSPSQPQFTRGSHEAQLQGLPHSVVTYTKCLGPCKQVFVVFVYPVILVLLSFPTPSHSSCLSQFTDPRSRALRTVLQDWLTTVIQVFQGNNDNVLILQESIFVPGVSVLYRQVVSEVVAVSGPCSSSVGGTLEGDGDPLAIPEVRPPRRLPSRSCAGKGRGKRELF